MIDQNKLAGILGSEIAGTATECMGVVGVQLTEAVSEFALTEFALTEDELKVCAKLPDILAVLADHNDCQSSMAAAMGYDESATFHANRASQLRAEGRRIESTW